VRSKYFEIHELVPRGLHERYTEKAWKFVDVRLIEIIDNLKEHFNLGSMTINNYYWDGSREWSGIRTPDSPYYKVGSQHSYGKALDIVWSDYTTKEVRDYVLESLDKFPHIKGLEIADWLHIDLRNEDSIVIFDANNRVYSIEEALQHN